MSTRISNAEINNLLIHLCNDMGKKFCLSQGELSAVRKWGGEHWESWCEIVPYGTVGAWKISHAPCYGGYVIEEFCEGGGIDHPFGSRRYKASEFVSMIHFAREALRLKTGEKK